jgi:hypothetical protein
MSFADLLKNSLALTGRRPSLKTFDLLPYIAKGVRPSTPMMSLAKLLGQLPSVGMEEKSGNGSTGKEDQCRRGDISFPKSTKLDSNPFGLGLS